MQASRFHTFQKGRQNGGRTGRTWYLMWNAADPYLGTRSFLILLLWKLISFQKETRGKNSVTPICLSVFEKQFSLVKALQVIEYTSLKSISAVIC